MTDETDVRPIDAVIAQDATRIKIWRLAMMALADRAAKWTALLMAFALFAYVIVTRVSAPWPGLVGASVFALFPVLLWWREMFPKKDAK